MDLIGKSRTRAGRRATAVALCTMAVLVVSLVAVAGAKRPAGPRLHASPARVTAGETVVLHGRGFPANAHIVLRATPPGRDAARIGEARTGLRGGFVAPIEIDAGAAPGAYFASACHDRCRVKATVRFRVLRPQTSH